MFRLARRRKDGSSTGAQTSPQAPSYGDPRFSVTAYRTQYQVLSSYLERPIGVSAHEVAQAEAGLLDRTRKMEKVPNERLLDLAVDLSEEVRYRHTNAPWSLGSNNKRVWPRERRAGQQAARVNLACLSPKGLLVVVMDAQAALGRRFPALSDDVLANDARLAQTLADHESRAAQELEESDARLARALSEQDDDTEHRRSQITDPIQILPEDVPDARPTRLRRPARPIEPPAAESMDADARTALRLQTRLSAQYHQAVSASISATASSSRSPPAADAGRQLNTDDKGLCVVCTDAQADTLLVDCRHLSMCHECAQGVLAISPPRCPVCRTEIRDKITSVIRVFLT